jgi:hypothetical protein
VGGETAMTNSDRIILDLLNALGAIEGTAMSDNSPACMRIGGIASQARTNVERCMSRNVGGYLVVTHDRKIDAGVSDGIEEVWRVNGCVLDLSNDQLREKVQKVIVDAVRAAI